MPAGTLVSSGSLVSPGGGQGPSGPSTIGLPIGTVMIWVAGGAPPAGWLSCDGSTISRTLYSDLFALVGTTYGTGDGVSTFGLPDLRGRVPVGAGQGTGLTNRILAATGGEEAHQLILAEAPSHAHALLGINNAGAPYSSGSTGFLFNNTAGTPYVSGGTDTRGGDGAHNTMQPFLVLSYIIKASATGGATNQAPIADTTQAGLMNRLSGLATDYVGGDNACHDFGLVRARSFNAVGNPNFEVDQRNCFTTVANIANGAFGPDRWQIAYNGTMRANVWTDQGQNILLPGTSYCISQANLVIQIATAQATLGASDFFIVQQVVEGPQWRELLGDVTSLSLLVKSDVANTKFTVTVRSNDATRSITYLCTAATLGWTLIPLPNIPKPTGGSFPIAPGNFAYILEICFACGSTYTSPGAGVWQNANFFGASGMSNFFANTVGQGFRIAFVQHEPGPQCSTLIDCPFQDNLRSAQRFWQKSYNYGVKPGTVDSSGSPFFWVPASQSPVTPVFFKCTMAKAPTIACYSTGTGAINNVRDLTAGLDRAVAAAQTIGDSGFSGFTLSGAANAAVAAYQFHYTADTGW